MISQISLTNFFSIKEQAILDLRAQNNRLFKNAETKDNTFADDSTSLLKSIAIFGPNASGKSNILKAIGACMRYICESHNYSESTPMQFEPFKFLDNATPSFFEMEFSIDGEKYEYGFGILHNRIVEEHLYTYPKRYKALVFKRELDINGETTYNFSKKFTRPKEVITNTSNFTLFLTRAALMNRPEPLKVLNLVTNHIIVGLPSFEDKAFEELLEKHKEEVITALRYADSDIVDYEFKSISGAGTAKRLVTYHKSNPSMPFNFDKEESAGTRRLLRLLAAFVDAADNDKLLIVDELETSLHSQLVRYAVKKFNRSNKAQLIFSTHDLSLLDTTILRPDQIYFAMKDFANGSSEVYSLSDFSDYKNYKNLRRDYEQGRFDAVPFISSF